jgi:hypothetical protein
MKQRGRKSMAALAVVGDGVVGVSPIHPPPTLSDAERNVWLGIVNAKPADWFGPEHVSMLTDYVRQVCRGHVIDEQIKAFDPEWLMSADGLKRYETLIGMAAKISGVQNTLLRSMRLTHQAVYRKDRGGMGPGRARKLWQHDPG